MINTSTLATKQMPTRDICMQSLIDLALDQPLKSRSRTCDLGPESAAHYEQSSPHKARLSTSAGKPLFCPPGRPRHAISIGHCSRALPMDGPGGTCRAAKYFSPLPRPARRACCCRVTSMTPYLSCVDHMLPTGRTQDTQLNSFENQR
jgi:hypothetical protein